MLPNNTDIQGKERVSCGGKWVRGWAIWLGEEKVKPKYDFDDIPSFFRGHIPSVILSF